MRKKPRISYWFFGKLCACASSLYLCPYVVRSTSRPRVILQKVTSHVTKNPNNTGERGASVFIGKKTVKNQRSFKKPHFGGGFFAIFRGSCLATSNKKPECEKHLVFFYASVNGSYSNFKLPNHCKTANKWKWYFQITKCNRNCINFLFRFISCS